MAILPPKPTEDRIEWRQRFDRETSHLDPVERKEWLRLLLDRATVRPNIPQRVRKEVYARDGYACMACGSSARLSLDHIHPYSLGGSDDPTNLQTLCMTCNVAKGVRV